MCVVDSIYRTKQLAKLRGLTIGIAWAVSHEVIADGDPLDDGLCREVFRERGLNVLGPVAIQGPLDGQQVLRSAECGQVTRFGQIVAPRARRCPPPSSVASSAVPTSAHQA